MLDASSLGIAPVKYVKVEKYYREKSPQRGKVYLCPSLREYDSLLQTKWRIGKCKRGGS